MAVEIIPAILARTPAELGLMEREVEPYSKRIHVDFMDGKFVPNNTVQPESIALLTEHWKEAHLMVNDNESYISKVLKLGFDEVIMHYESCKDIHGMIKKVKLAGRKVALAINPPTPISSIESYLDDLDMVLVMAVNPGLSGQPFDFGVLPKISELRRERKSLDIEVDGGIKVGTAGIAAVAGANMLASNSGIYGFADKKKAIKALKDDVKTSLKGAVNTL